MEPLIVLVGGFLGAGKTTLLLEAARRLQDAGYRAALITNDQGGALVDTMAARATGTPAEEITGGCFCCRFSDLVRSADRLRVHNPDVIFAEPVGSCIDLSATVLQPLKQYYADQYRLAPFTVLVDPQRASELLSPDAEPHLAYLFTNQLAEADIVCFNKADLYTEFPELPSGFALRLSALTGQGVSEWLREVMAGSQLAGSRLLQDVDYSYYAEAEAALGWLNWQGAVSFSHPAIPAEVAGPLLEAIDEKLSAAGIRIAHLKIWDRADTGQIRASICANGEEPSVQGALDASPGLHHELIINLRACGAPENLERAVRESAGTLRGILELQHLESFRPSPPKPEYRIHRVSEV